MEKRFRDSAFTLLFRREEYVVQMYEMLTGKKLDPSKIQSVRLEDGLEKSRLYNDVSFLTEDNELLVLIEHQTAPNKNMCFRLLEYYVLFMSKYVKEKGYNKHGTMEIEIPKAQFFVVYNGEGEMKDLPTLDLGDVQVRAKVSNIHFDKLPYHDHDNAVVAYAHLVEIAKNKHINEALDQMVEEGYLIEFFGRKENRDMFAEVFSYDNELRNEGHRQGFQRGKQEGRQEGRQEGIIDIAKRMKEAGADIAFILQTTGLSKEQLVELGIE